MANVTVCDLRVIERAVEVPEQCPACGLPFDNNTNHLVLWEYQDQSRSAFFKNGELEYGNDLPNQGEAYLEMEWKCRSCGHVVAAGQIEEVPSGT